MAAIGPVSLEEVAATSSANGCARSTSSRRAIATGASSSAARSRRAGASFRVVFVPGLAERMFPQKPREDPLLLDEEMRAPLDAGLAVQDDRAGTERLLLRLAVGAATERLWLSYPRIDVAGARPRVPSFYVLDVMRAITGRDPEPRGAAARRPRPKAAHARRGRRRGEPADAIDDVEHDLADAARAARGAGPAIGSRARALSAAAQRCAARSVTERWARARAPWMPQDGLVRVTPA